MPEVFYLWTLARVSKTPSQAYMRLWVRFDNGKAHWDDSAQPTIQTRFGSETQTQLGNYLEAIKELGLESVDVRQIPTPLPGHAGLMVFTKPLKDVIPSGAIPVNANYGAADVKLDIRKVRLYKNYVVWEVTPVEAILAK